ncbi:glucosamine-6-phosphate deaminase [Dellaglioa carnosa]|uniref:Glucosamine-6-phosphate deaminase n=1 Tax=Dellaglioa carnosa TaxID=2995136 RepID=A0ABT4JKY9_9LACO|nr:glucosamine-6-phosphate deaminase [Dellaglioa carnosa]MCZ2490626.1 glucosamine-6-phosphate deaminase [Dellaglioa carnosa]MCZ2493704.1 glucosamine-6-phosphate deaminase [Dellaglioa carnosa]MDK1730568.1 glucosamine-6-phosphate deaminase [Dellaglioa carnosa]
MKLIIVKDQNEGGQKGYEVFKAAKDANAKVFGLATGSTPLTTYAAITASDLDFTDATSVNLDEYVGLGEKDSQSYRYFMNENLFSKKPFKTSYLPNGLEEDAEKETKRYDKIIEENPIDLQILGIGKNGHIGFNEPGTAGDSLTHKVHLTESTIKSNARFFENEADVPNYAYSMGIGSIMKSKKILLEAFGESKAEAIKGMIEGPVTEDVPASFLQNHDDVTVIVDEAAASLLKNK